MVMSEATSFAKNVLDQSLGTHEILFIPNELVYERMGLLLTQVKDFKRFLEFQQKTDVSRTQNAITNSKSYYSLDFVNDDLE